MRLIGKLTTGVVLVGMVAGIFVAVRSLPDIRRYLEMRRM
ncbi:MAG: DUF6893 family small protein [Nocardioidaceae bacterium]